MVQIVAKLKKSETYSLESVMLVSGAMCGGILEECGGGGGEFACEPCLEDIRLIKTGLGLLTSFAN